MYKPQNFDGPNHNLKLAPLATTFVWLIIATRYEQMTLKRKSNIQANAHSLKKRLVKESK